jgi:hypothetical protein
LLFGGIETTEGMIANWRERARPASFIRANNRSVMPTTEEASCIPPLSTLKPTTSTPKPPRPTMNRQRGRAAWARRITAMTASSAGQSYGRSTVGSQEPMFNPQAPVQAVPLKPGRRYAERRFR